MNWKTSVLNKIATCKNFLIFLKMHIKTDTVMRVASSLSYTSLIALVPLFAIALAIFSAFPVFGDIKDQLQHVLIKSFSPDMEQEISQYFTEFVGATAKLTAIGVIGIAVTAILLLSTIENGFNYIFKVYKPRRFTTKITLYWTVITLGPLLVGTVFSLRGYLASAQDIVPGVFLSYVLPAAITIFALFIVYLLVPNKQIKIINALAGAVTSYILFGFLRKGFAYFMIKSATYKTIYGAMAILPVFLIWMYLAWAVVIFGAVITAALEEFQQPEEKLKKGIDNRTKIEQSGVRKKNTAKKGTK